MEVEGSLSVCEREGNDESYDVGVGDVIVRLWVGEIRLRIIVGENYQWNQFGLPIGIS